MPPLRCSAPNFTKDFTAKLGRDTGGAGRPISIAEIAIAGPSGVDAPGWRSRRNSRARTTGLMLGYLNQPELTADALRGGWMHTGDGGRLDEHGNPSTLSTE